MMSGERLVDDAALSVSWEGHGMGGGGPEHVDMFSWTLFFFFFWRAFLFGSYLLLLICST